MPAPRGRTHLIIPDVQAKPGVPLEHLTWIGKYIAHKRPDVIVQIGDFADMPSLSSYDKGKKSFEGRRYRDDISAAKRAMDMLTSEFIHVQDYSPQMFLTLGNHEDRIRRATEDNPELDGLISVKDLHYENFGWEVVPFLKPVVVDGITYAHYFTTGVMGRPVGSAAVLAAKGVSAVMGHVQTTDATFRVRPDGQQIFTLFAGICYLHDEEYLGAQGNVARRQIVMLHEVDGKGGADPMFVSLNFLRNRYGREAA